MAAQLQTATERPRSRFAEPTPAGFVPMVGWLKSYRRADLAGDLIAGLIVAIMLVPQGMAYAMLAGLPPQVGLYASIAPMVVYAVLGTSRVLSVGPVAVDSLLVAAGVGALATHGTPEYVGFALVLALMVGAIQLAMGAGRLGFLVNFLSQPVLAGFTAAAAIVIGLSQLKHLLGVQVASGGRPFEVLRANVESVGAANPATVVIGVTSAVVLVAFARYGAAALRLFGVPESVSVPLSRGGPLVVVALSTLAVWSLGLDRVAGVTVVGAIPAGLPSITVPSVDVSRVLALLPTAFAIAAIAITEAVSTATALASKRRQRIDPDRELVALGAANVGAAFTGGYPVTGGLSRSAVNFAAGANTSLASLVTAALVALTVLYLTPLFHYLPPATLAAVIIVAAAKLVDVSAVRHVWRYSKADGFSQLATFVGVLVFDVAAGVGIGVVASVVLYLWRTSRPHVAVVGRVGDTEHFRNVLRHDVTTYPKVLAIRIDESLYFANAKFLETTLLRAVADRPEIEHLVLICSGTNFVDASALETLARLVSELRDAGVGLYLAEVKGPVMDRLDRIGFVDLLGRDRVYLSTHDAMRSLGY